MNGLWNPFAFTVAGDPGNVLAPPALRVQGDGQATAEHMALAQQTFYRFCERARTSVVPNPTEMGRMTDGTPYRITVVGPQAIMEIWPGKPDQYSGGIGIRLTDLTGGLVPGHIHADEVRPQPYILSPVVKPGTRITTGEWRVRKVNDYVGGKAAWVSKSGRKALTSFGGVDSDGNLLERPAYEARFGPNQRAYWMRPFLVEEGPNVYTDGGKQIGILRGGESTMPFFRLASDGVVWIMQIVADVDSDNERLLLYGDPVSSRTSGPTQPIGNLLSELLVPDGYMINWQSVSVSNDGKAARLTLLSRSREIYGKMDVQITDYELKSAGVTYGPTSAPGSETSESSTTGSGSTATTIYRRQSVAGWQVVPVGYGYDLRGKPTDITVRTASGRIATNDDGTTIDALTVIYTGEWPAAVSPDDDWLYRKETRVVTQEFRSTQDGITVTGGGVSIRAGTTTTTRSASYTSISEYFRVPDGTDYTTNSQTGGGVLTRSQVGVTILYVDPSIELLAKVEPRRDVTVTSVAGEPDVTVETFSRKLSVLCKGTEVLSLDESMEGWEDASRKQFVASYAVDPYTGATCLNILELETFTVMPFPPVLRSWIILADDTGGKFLHEVMDMPEDTETDIRIKNDSSLLSVL